VHSLAIYLRIHVRFHPSGRPSRTTSRTSSPSSSASPILATTQPTRFALFKPTPNHTTPNHRLPCQQSPHHREHEAINRELGVEGACCGQEQRTRTPELMGMTITETEDDDDELHCSPPSGPLNDVVEHAPGSAYRCTERDPFASIKGLASKSLLNLNQPFCLPHHQRPLSSKGHSPNHPRH
jgi:hypothetical protein